MTNDETRVTRSLFNIAWSLFFFGTLFGLSLLGALRLRGALQVICIVLAALSFSLLVFSILMVTAGTRLLERVVDAIGRQPDL